MTCRRGVWVPGWMRAPEMAVGRWVVCPMMRNEILTYPTNRCGSLLSMLPITVDIGKVLHVLQTDLSVEKQVLALDESRQQEWGRRVARSCQRWEMVVRPETIESESHTFAREFARRVARVCIPKSEQYGHRELSTQSRAILGSDGRYHLLDQSGEMSCSLGSESEEPGLFTVCGPNHVLRYNYLISLNTGVPIKGSQGTASETWASREVLWHVVPEEEVRGDLENIPPRLRCYATYLEIKTLWPNYESPTSYAKRRYRKVVAELGESCAVCGSGGNSSIPLIVDHDHHTNRIRGILCQLCNDQVDRCPHPDPSLCRFAAYLHTPPALGLGMTFWSDGNKRSLIVPNLDARFL